MSFRIINNQVWHDAVELHVGNTSSTLQEPVDAFNLTTGPRHLVAKTDLAVRRVTYLNKSGGLSADTVVVGDIRDAVTHQVIIRHHSSYTDDFSGGTDIFNASNFSDANLTGPGNQDMIRTFTEVTNQQAFHLFLGTGTGGAWEERAAKFYVGSSLTLDNPIYPVVESAFYSTERLGKQYYKTEHRGRFTFANVSRAELDDLENLDGLRTEPFFLYDDTSSFIREELWHCILLDLRVTPQFNDLYQLQIDVARLRRYV